MLSLPIPPLDDPIEIGDVTAPIIALMKAGVALDSLGIRSRTLEELCLELTGKELRVLLRAGRRFPPDNSATRSSRCQTQLLPGHGRRWLNGASAWHRSTAQYPLVRHPGAKPPKARSRT